MKKDCYELASNASSRPSNWKSSLGKNETANVLIDDSQEQINDEDSAELVLIATDEASGGTQCDDYVCVHQSVAEDDIVSEDNSLGDPKEEDQPKKRGLREGSLQFLFEILNIHALINPQERCIPLLIG